MKLIDKRESYARTTYTYELEEHELNLTEEELKNKIYMPFGGYATKYGQNRVEIVRYDD